eukprot:Hpha_TRINITY_DN16080_c0_g3::TRINITY_DN16080_c0_g3_i1::g.121450::m.121450
MALNTPHEAPTSVPIEDRSGSLGLPRRTSPSTLPQPTPESPSHQSTPPQPPGEGSPIPRTHTPGFEGAPSLSPAGSRRGSGTRYSGEGEELEEEDEEECLNQTLSHTRSVEGSGSLFVYTYETQRWFPMIGWGKKRLPTDCPEWVDSKRKAKPREEVRIPPDCRWEGEWEIDKNTGGIDGWEYAGDWWWKYHSSNKKGDCVRRRKWIRRYVSVAPPGLPLIAAAARESLSQDEELDASLGRLTGSIEIGGGTPKPGGGSPRADKDLHRTFPDLPAEDHLVADFQCSYRAGKIDRLGKMYITAEHVCFASPLLASPIQWAFGDIEHLIKKKDLLVLSAIVVVVGGSEHIFTAFVSRDAAFSTLSDLWEAAQKKAGNDPAVLRRAAEEARVIRQEKKRRQTTVKTPSPGRGPTSPGPTAAGDGGGGAEVNVEPLSGAGAGDMSGHFEGTALTESFVEESTILTHKEAKQIHAPHKLPQGADIGAVWGALVRDSAFLQAYHKKGGRYAGQKSAPQEVQMPAWEGGKAGMGWRDFVCITVVQAPFSTHTKYTEKQRYVLLAGPPKQLLIHFVSQTPEVTAGDSFKIEVLVTIEEKADKQCEISVNAYINFLKSSWLKGKITSAAFSELTSSYQTFVKMAHDHVASFLSGKPAAPSPAEGAPAVPAAAAAGGVEVAVEKPKLSLENGLRVVVVLVLIWAVFSAWQAASATQEAVAHFAQIAAAVASAGRCQEVPGCEGTKAAEALTALLNNVELTTAAAGATSLVVSQSYLAMLLALCTLLGATAVALIFAK